MSAKTCRADSSFCALCVVHREIAADALGARGRQLDDRVNRFEELAIVADDDRASVPTLVEPDEKTPALAIEIVGRLIEKQEIGSA